MLHALYLAFSHISAPVFRRAQGKALASGKDDPRRAGERWGKPTQERPTGPLIWFHAASVGETQSILPLITRLLAARPGANVLVTSATQTSADLLAQDLPTRALHQMVPYDTPHATRAFLHHWQPDAAIWVESELWPRMLREVDRARIPRMLINARVSDRTAKRWRKAPATVHTILSGFQTIHAQDSTTHDLIAEIGIPADRLSLTGALKRDKPPLPHDANTLTNLRAQVDGRALWCASSTHPGEDAVMLTAHKDHGGLLLLVPRHPNRGEEVTAEARAMGFDTAQRTKGDAITATTEVYVADTMGELGLWYRLAPISVIAGSFSDVGGHNPYEAIELGSAVLHGPHIGNFADIYAKLNAAGGAVQITNPTDLAQALRTVDPAALTAAAQGALKTEGGATDAALTAILDLLD